MTFIGVIFTFVFIQNVFLSRMLGLPDSGEPAQTGFSVLGACLLLALSLISSMAAWGISALAEGLHAGIVFLPAFCVAFLAVVSLLELSAKKAKRAYSGTLTMEIRKIEASGLAFGIGILTNQGRLTLLSVTVASAACVGGYACANLLFGKIMERLSLSHVPKAFRGTPIMLLNMGLISLAFMCFDQIFLRNLIG
jgi:electron transport complex protein RnfA